MKRITTEYMEHEDRIRLSCELEDGSTVMIWLTQRLARRVVAALVQTKQADLKKIICTEMTHQVMQVAAKNSPQASQPVRTTVKSDNWLTRSVDITSLPQALRLTFKGAEAQHVILMLTPVMLRQWLDMLHKAFVTGGWGVDVWPTWGQFGVLESELASAIWH